MNKIYVSKAEIKHTNDKIVITLYALNREIDILKKKYFKINKEINNKLLGKFLSLYRYNFYKIFKLIVRFKNKNKYIFASSF